MDVRDREEFNLGIQLSRSNQPQAACFIFSRLQEKYPQDNQVIVLAALTSFGPVETKTVFEAAMHLDPADPILVQAIEWLEKRPSTPDAKSIPEVDPDPTLKKPFVNQLENLRTGQVQTVERPIQPQFLEIPAASPSTALKEEIDPPSQEITQKLIAPDGIPAPETAIVPEALTAPEVITEPGAEALPEAKTVRPGEKPKKAKKTAEGKPKTAQAKNPIAAFSLLWWVRLACSLIFFGSALAILTILVTANNLNSTEKAYAEGVSNLTQKTSAVSTQLQTAIADFNAGKLDRAGLEQQLQGVIGLNDALKQLKSPSPRFDKLDGLLGIAYGYFNDGATNLINALESGDLSKFSDGYHLFDLGNDTLRQARDELKALGG